MVTTAPTAAPPPPRREVTTQPLLKSGVRFGNIARRAGQRIGLYGPGGIGKTLLAACAPGPVAFFDYDKSLPILADQLAAYDVRPVRGAETWEQLMAALQGDGWSEIKTIVIDTLTRAEELAAADTLKHVKDDRGQPVARIEGYGYGKGWTYLFDTFLPLLAVLDRHVDAGRNVVLIMHDCTANVPNPHGDDYIRYEPRLSSPGSGKASIRLRVREWLDHLFFLGYDLEVKDGKGRGSGTRTLYPVELPHCMAKSRTLAESFELIRGDLTLWNKLFNTKESGA